MSYSRAFQGKQPGGEGCSRWSGVWACPTLHSFHSLFDLFRSCGFFCKVTLCFCCIYCTCSLHIHSSTNSAARRRHRALRTRPENGGGAPRQCRRTVYLEACNSDSDNKHMAAAHVGPPLHVFDETPNLRKRRQQTPNGGYIKLRRNTFLVFCHGLGVRMLHLALHLE